MGASTSNVFSKFISGIYGEPHEEDLMTEEQTPSEQRGGTTPDDAEAREKGEWAGRAGDGVVPAGLGGSDAPREMLDEDRFESGVLGRTTGSTSRPSRAGST